MPEEIPNDEAILEGIPSEGDPVEETPKEEPAPPAEEPKEELKLPEKEKRWRDLYFKEKQAKSEPPSPVAPPSEDAEAKAQKYIEDAAERAYKRLQEKQKVEENKAIQDFQEKLNIILEDNPDFKEDDILEICEKFTVEPEVAVRILKEYKSKTEVKKPNLPSPKRTAPGTPEQKGRPETEKGKSLYDIAQTVKKELRERFKPSA